MASLNVVVLTKNKRTDGLFVGYIRVSHSRKVRYINTGILVHENELKKDFSIKSGETCDLLNSLLSQYRKRVNEFLSIVDYHDVTVEDIVQYIQDKNQGKEFFELIRQYSERLRKETTRHSYTALMSILKKYLGRDELYTNEITSAFLYDLEANLRKTYKLSSIIKIMSNIRAVFTFAMKKYNKQELNIIAIRFNPFDNYSLPKKEIGRYRALSVDFIRSLKSMPTIYSLRYVNTPLTSHFIARDMFLLSFYLCGINAIDLYYMKKQCLVDGRLNYCRIKTKDSRADNAFTSIQVLPEAMEIINEYTSREPNSDLLLCLKERYKTIRTFRSCLSLGFQYIRDTFPNTPEYFTYYCARHSWATIARNKVNVALEDICFALNHSSGTVAEMYYIEKDWTLIDRANILVQNYVFPERDKSMDNNSKTIQYLDISKMKDLSLDLPKHAEMALRWRLKHNLKK